MRLLLLLIIGAFVAAPFVYPAWLHRAIEGDVQTMLTDYRGIATALKPLATLPGTPSRIRSLLASLDHVVSATGGTLSLQEQSERVAQAQSLLEQIHAAAETASIKLHPTVQFLARQLEPASSALTPVLERYHRHAMSWNAWQDTLPAFLSRLVGMSGATLPPLSAQSSSERDM